MIDSLECRHRRHKGYQTEAFGTVPNGHCRPVHGRVGASAPLVDVRPAPTRRFESTRYDPAQRWSPSAKNQQGTTAASDGQKFAMQREAMDEVIDWLTFYNHRRLHSTLAYVSPIRFEANWHAGQAKKAA